MVCFSPISLSSINTIKQANTESAFVVVTASVATVINFIQKQNKLCFKTVFNLIYILHCIELKVAALLS